MTIVTCNAKFSSVKILLLRSIKIHISMTTSRSHIEKNIQTLIAVSKINIFALKSHNKFQFLLLKNEKFLQNT